MKRKYKIDLVINGRPINEIKIDPHYELKHGDSINDDLILKLVSCLGRAWYAPIAKRPGYEYFVNDDLLVGEKEYRLIWCLEDHQLFVGVINCFRRK